MILTLASGYKRANGPLKYNIWTLSEQTTYQNLASIFLESLCQQLVKIKFPRISLPVPHPRSRTLRGALSGVQWSWPLPIIIQSVWRSSIFTCQSNPSTVTGQNTHRAVPSHPEKRERERLARKHWSKISKWTGAYFSHNKCLWPKKCVIPCRLCLRMLGEAYFVLRPSLLRLMRFGSQGKQQAVGKKCHSENFEEREGYTMHAKISNDV